MKKDNESESKASVSGGDVEKLYFIINNRAGDVEHDS